MRQFIDFFAETLFPSQCYRCKKYGTYLCKECYIHILSFPHSVCFHCNKETSTAKLPSRCKKETYLDRLYTCADYSDKHISKLIKDLKYKRAKKLSLFIARYAYWWLINKEFIDDFKKTESKIITCVPSHIKKEKERGFNHAEEIAKDLSVKLGVLFEKNILIKQRNIYRQVEMGTKEGRRENIRNAYTTSTGIRTANETVIIVDDVITTGATMRECARTLKEAGAKEVWGFAIAKD